MVGCCRYHAFYYFCLNQRLNQDRWFKPMSKSTEHKEGRATVKVVLYTSKTLKNGEHPFMVRITKDRKLKYVATGLSLASKYWNPERGELRRNYPEPLREQLQKKLREWENKYQDAANGLAQDDQQHDATTVVTKAAQERRVTRRIKLLAYIDELADTMKAGGQVGNAGVYRDLKNQLAKFIADEYADTDLQFDRINVPFCNEWEATLRATGVEEITLSLRFRTLRAVLNKAIANGLMKAEHYPFARSVAERHKFQVGKFDVSTTKRAIPRESISLLEAFEPTTDRLKLAKDVFLFSFYCGGINFVDLAQLRWPALTVVQQPAPKDPITRLQYVRQKTGGKFSLPLHPSAVAIVSRYRPLTGANAGSYIFPILDPTKHQTPTQIKNRLHKILGQVNQDLKELGKTIGLTTPLTTYVARHSFATTLKLNGASTGVISQAMGHKSEAVTAVYLDSFASELVDAAYDLL